MSLQELLIVLGGFSITTAILVWLTHGNLAGFNQLPDLNELFGQSSICLVLLILNVLRFYHGNNRHLHDSYLLSDAEYIKFVRQDTPRYRNLILIDFAGAFAASCYLAVLGFLVNRTDLFAKVFFQMLVIDIIYFAILGLPTFLGILKSLWSDGASLLPFKHLLRSTVDPNKWSYGTKWMANNIVHWGVYHSVPLSLVAKYTDHPEWFYLFVILSNTVIDFVVSWSIYFGGPMDKGTKCFVAAPFSACVDPRSHLFSDAQVRQRIETIISEVRRAGMVPLSSHLVEDWGEKTPKDKDLFARNYRWSAEADLFILLADGTQSEGIFMELAWAINCSIPVLVAAAMGSTVSPMVCGAVEEGLAVLVSFDPSDPVSLANRINIELQAF